MVKILLDDKETERSLFVIFCKKQPKYGNNLRKFGEIGVLRDHERKLEAKLDNCGNVYAMVGYANDHSGDMYRMLDLRTKKVKITFEVIWLYKPYGT